MTADHAELVIIAHHVQGKRICRNQAPYTAAVKQRYTDKMQNIQSQPVAVRAVTFGQLLYHILYVLNYIEVFPQKAQYKSS
jgi:hypothetical protein